MSDHHPHWIPVEESLPSDGTNTIVYGPEIGRCISGLREDGKWARIGANQAYGDGEVTHWLELPMPPPRNIPQSPASDFHKNNPQWNRLYRAARDMLSGIDIHNARLQDGQQATKIEGPLVSNLREAVQECKGRS